MPTVPAAGYPYQAYPETRPPLTPPEDYQRIQTTPEMFGARVGAQQERLGEIGERGASQLAEATIQRQQLYNQIVADKAQGEYNSKSNALLFGDPKAGTVGLYGMHGEDAMRESQRIMGEGGALDQLRQQISSTLPNARSQLEFNEYTRRQRMFQEQGIGAHYMKEMSAVGEATHKAGLQGAIDLAGTNYNNPGIITEAVNQVLSNSARLAQDQLGQTVSDEIVKNTFMNPWLDSLATSVVNGFMAHQDWSGAENFLKTAYIANPATRAKLEKEVHDKSITFDVTADVFGKGGGAPRQLVSYTPNATTGLPATVGVSGDQYDTFRHYMASREAGSYLEPPNKQGYMGQYQMNMEDITTTAKRMGIPAPTQSEFLNNPDLQERMFENYTLHNYDQLKDYPRFANASPAEKLGILAGAHLGGVDGVKEYLEGKRDRQDANGTKVSDYVKNTTAAVNNGGGPSFNVEAAIADARAKYPNDEDFAKAITVILERARVTAAAGAERTRARNEANDNTVNEFMSRILDPDQKNPVTDRDLQEATATGRLKGETAGYLRNFRDNKVTNDINRTNIDEGPGYWDVRNRIMLPAGDPRRITDVNQVLALAQPFDPGGGRPQMQWLTNKGSQDIMNLMTTKKTSLGEAMAQTEHAILTEAEKQITASPYGMGSQLKDPKGATQFAKFLGKALPIIEAAKAEGPEALGALLDFDKGPLANLIKQAIRDPSVWMKDLMTDNPALEGAPPGTAVGRPTGGPAPPIATPAPSRRPSAGGAAAKPAIQFDSSGNRVQP